VDKQQAKTKYKLRNWSAYNAASARLTARRMSPLAAGGATRSPETGVIRGMGGKGRW
jgi:hypothetical protein